jgi:hypothetical protein
MRPCIRRLFHDLDDPIALDLGLVLVSGECLDTDDPLLQLGNGLLYLRSAPLEKENKIPKLLRQSGCWVKRPPAKGPSDKPMYTADT